MNTSITLVIGCGRGPRQARRFVGLLADAIAERLDQRGAAVDHVAHHGDRDEPGRVVLQVRLGGATVDDLLGTHLLTADLRGPRARRRWFAAVERHERPDTELPALARHDLDIRFVRASGPGGQNVNKRATAVQILHRPTGLRVSCDRHRTQARNRADALRSLRERVAAAAQQVQGHGRTEAWLGRREITTHTPVMRWRLADKSGERIAPAR